jgi:hypothetical protein
MPRIELRDPFGTCYVITSSNPDTIAAWLLEHARMATDNRLGPWMLGVYPAFSPQTGPGGQPVSDWPTGISGTADHYLLAAGQLGRLAQWLEAEMGRGEFPPERDSGDEQG